MGGSHCIAAQGLIKTRCDLWIPVCTGMTNETVLTHTTIAITMTNDAASKRLLFAPSAPTWVRARHHTVALQDIGNHTAMSRILCMKLGSWLTDKRFCIGCGHRSPPEFERGQISWSAELSEFNKFCQSTRVGISINGSTVVPKNTCRTIKLVKHKEHSG